VEAEKVKKRTSKNAPSNQQTLRIVMKFFKAKPEYSLEGIKCVLVRVRFAECFFPLSRQAHAWLLKNTPPKSKNLSKHADTLRCIAETIVWGDRHDRKILE
jgi:hypothetical protein